MTTDTHGGVTLGLKRGGTAIAAIDNAAISKILSTSARGASPLNPQNKIRIPAELTAYIYAYLEQECGCVITLSGIEVHAPNSNAHRRALEAAEQSSPSLRSNPARSPASSSSSSSSSSSEQSSSEPKPNKPVGGSSKTCTVIIEAGGVARPNVSRQIA